MTFTAKELVQRALKSLSDPKGSARWVQSHALPRHSRWEVLALIVLVSVILGQITGFILYGEIQLVMGALVLNPIALGIIQMAVLAMSVFAIFWIGRAMGGTGDFDDTILLVAWLQVIMALLQVVQTVAILLVPPLGSLIGVASFALFFWLLANFIAQLHGFQSLPKVLGMIFVSIFGLSFGITLLLSLIGITMPGVY